MGNCHLSVLVRQGKDLIFLWQQYATILHSKNLRNNDLIKKLLCCLIECIASFISAGTTKFKTNTSVSYSDASVALSDVSFIIYDISVAASDVSDTLLVASDNSLVTSDNSLVASVDSLVASDKPLVASILNKENCKNHLSANEFFKWDKQHQIRGPPLFKTTINFPTIKN